jgi:hypothetical protein
VIRQFENNAKQLPFPDENSREKFAKAQKHIHPNALKRIEGSILEHSFSAIILRLSRLHLLVKEDRHHLLTSSLWKTAARNRAAKSDKKQQRICRNLSLRLAAFCRLLSLGAQLVFKGLWNNLWVIAG